MSERMRESLSALMDDEANELELERILAHIADDSELRQTWVRYNVVRSVSSGHALDNHALDHMNLDVSAQVRKALTQQARRGPSLRHRLLRPVASIAVAASVAATVVIGGQQLAQMGTAPFDYNQAIASSVSPVGMLNSLGATPVKASFGTRSVPVLQPATRTAYQELARQRMQLYMQEHAEHAALNSPQGLIPFARVQQIQE